MVIGDTKGQRIIMAFFAILIVGLIFSHFIGMFFPSFVISATIPIFLVMVGIIIWVALLVVRAFSQKQFDLGTLGLIGVAAALVFMFIQFPQLVPNVFSVSANNAISSLPLLIPISLARGGWHGK